MEVRTLYQLVYVSGRTPRLDDPTLVAITASSAVRNRQRNITGVLACCGENLLQLLEGDASSVEALFESIRQDPRHQNVVCVLRKTVRKRLFPEWGMGLYVPRSRAKVNVDRMATLINDVRARVNTETHSVEARLLLNDFEQQMRAA